MKKYYTYDLMSEQEADPRGEPHAVYSAEAVDALLQEVRDVLEPFHGDGTHSNDRVVDMDYRLKQILDKETSEPRTYYDPSTSERKEY